MLLPSTVNYPCQPRRIKHRRRRPAQSLTRAGPPPPHQLQNKWLLVSPHMALGLVWPLWHRDLPQHQAGTRCQRMDSSWKAPERQRELGIDWHFQQLLQAACCAGWFSSCSPGVAPVGCPCHCGDVASSGLTSCRGSRSTWGRREVSAQLPLLYFPGKDL